MSVFLIVKNCYKACTMQTYSSKGSVFFSTSDQKKVIEFCDNTYLNAYSLQKLPKPDSKIPKLDPVLVSTDSNDSIQSRTARHGIHTIKKYKVSRFVAEIYLFVI